MSDNGLVLYALRRVKRFNSQPPVRLASTTLSSRAAHAWTSRQALFLRMLNLGRTQTHLVFLVHNRKHLGALLENYGRGRMQIANTLS